MPSTRARSLVAECLGTALLLAAVMGSGIMGEHRCGGHVADAPGFIGAQVLGAAGGTVVLRGLGRPDR